MRADEIIQYMETLHDEEQRQLLMRFFKTGPGEYGDGDEFLGLKVPQTREIVNHVWKDISLDEVSPLLLSRWHEVRLCGLLILVAKFGKASTKRLVHDPEARRQREEILDMYLRYAERANNWDLVDLSAPKILGAWLVLEGCCEDTISTMDALASSSNLWLQRISMVCTWATSQSGDPTWCLRMAERHLRHPHDLMHKAVGWMLREMGKRVSMDILRDFLRRHIHEMHRTTLRYAIEKMSADERHYWMVDAEQASAERSAALRRP